MCARVRPRARARMCRQQLQFLNCFSCPYLFIVPRGFAGTGLGLSIAATAFSCPYRRHGAGAEHRQGPRPGPRRRHIRHVPGTSVSAGAAANAAGTIAADAQTPCVRGWLVSGPASSGPGCSGPGCLVRWLGPKVCPSPISFARRHPCDFACVATPL